MHSHSPSVASCLVIPLCYRVCSCDIYQPVWSLVCVFVCVCVCVYVCVCVCARARVAKPEPVIRLDAFSVLIAGGMEDESAGQIALHIGSLSLICFLLRQKARLVFALSYSMHAGRQKQQAAQVDVRHV